MGIGSSTPRPVVPTIIPIMVCSSDDSLPPVQEFVHRPSALYHAEYDATIHAFNIIMDGRIVHQHNVLPFGFEISSRFGANTPQKNLKFAHNKTHMYIASETSVIAYNLKGWQSTAEIYATELHETAIIKSVTCTDKYFFIDVECLEEETAEQALMQARVENDEQPLELAQLQAKMQAAIADNKIQKMRARFSVAANYLIEKVVSHSQI